MNIINFELTQFKESCKTNNEIIKTIYLYNPTEQDIYFLDVHNNYKNSDLLCDELGHEYLFKLNSEDLSFYDPIESNELYIQGFKANKKYIDLMYKAREQGFTMIKFAIVNDLEFMRDFLN